jgi:uncharacterized protein YegJ (DUF2314 family)
MVRELLSRSFGAVVVIAGVALIGGAIWFAYDTGRWAHLGGALLGVVFLSVGWPRLFPDVFRPQVIDPEDPLMTAAMDQARREVDRLKEAVSEGRKQAFIKFPLGMQNGATEHIWGLAHQIEGEDVVVSLVNDPIDTPKTEDPRMRVALAEIEDWTLLSGDGSTEGGYTMKAMAQIYKRDKGYLPRNLRKELAMFKDFRIEDI